MAQLYNPKNMETIQTTGKLPLKYYLNMVRDIIFLDHDEYKKLEKYAPEDFYNISSEMLLKNFGNL